MAVIQYSVSYVHSCSFCGCLKLHFRLILVRRHTHVSASLRNVIIERFCQNPEQWHETKSLLFATYISNQLDLFAASYYSIKRLESKMQWNFPFRKCFVDVVFAAVALYFQHDNTLIP